VKYCTSLLYSILLIYLSYLPSSSLCLSSISSFVLLVHQLDLLVHLVLVLVRLVHRLVHRVLVEFIIPL